MGHEVPGFLGSLGFGQSLSRWRRTLKAADKMSTPALETLTKDITRLRDELDDMGSTAASALRNRPDRAQDFERPDQCDWAVRPDVWVNSMRPRGIVSFASAQKLPGDITVFHDANIADISLRQDPAPASLNGPLFGLVFEIYRFDGSFVSLVQDLPKSALVGLTRNHYIAVSLHMAFDQPIECYARLNVQHGPNTEQLVRQIEVKDETATAEFDLAYSNINEKRLDRAWLDLIIEGPSMTQIAIWDMVLLRALRADV